MNSTRGGGSREPWEVVDECAPAVEEALVREARIRGVSRDETRGRGSRPAVRVTSPVEGCSPAPLMSNRKASGTTNNTRRACARTRSGSRASRGVSSPRISLRGSAMLSAREEVARGARLGRESGMIAPRRSRDSSGAGAGL